MAWLRALSRCSGELAGKCSVSGPRVPRPPRPSLLFNGERVLPSPPSSASPHKPVLVAARTGSECAGASADLLRLVARRVRAAVLRGSTEASMPERGGAARNLIVDDRSARASMFASPSRRGADSMSGILLAARHHGSAHGAGGRCGAVLLARGAFPFDQLARPPWRGADGMGGSINAARHTAQGDGFPFDQLARPPLRGADGMGGSINAARHTAQGDGFPFDQLARPPLRGADGMDVSNNAARHHGSDQGACGSCGVAVHDGDGSGFDHHRRASRDGMAAAISVARNRCEAVAEIARRRIMRPQIYLQKRGSSSWRGGHVPSPQGPYWRHRRIVLRRPEFLPTRVPDPNAPIKKWRTVENVPGIVLEPCFGVASLHLKQDPREYVKTHPMMEVVPVLGEPSGTFLCKFAEQGKYTSKSLIDLVGTLHDMDCCVPTLSVDSVAINSAGKFELILSKTTFTKLTPQGVRDDYRNAALVLEELIGGEMPKEARMLFDYMKTDGYYYRYLIAVNVALLPTEARSSVYMAFYECLNDQGRPVGDRSLLNRLLESLPHRKIWAIRASNNRFLVEWLRYQDDRSRKLLWGSTEELYNTVRNVIAHRMGLQSRRRKYKARSVDDMLLALFPELLARIQLFWFEEQRLKEFNLEAYFQDRKVTEEWVN